jgi:hypothetical protein
VECISTSPSTRHARTELKEYSLGRTTARTQELPGSVRITNRSSSSNDPMESGQALSHMYLELT